MRCVKLTLLAYLFIGFLCPNYILAWGTDGHFTICTIAQSRLSDGAKEAVKELVAEGDFANVCSWADHVKFRYHWSSPLHYINVPDSLCNFQYTRDCKDEDGVKDRCVAGAINNYTAQLLTSKNSNVAARSSQYNLTEALLFLGHFMGDIHQPLHVGHVSDKGGNTIHVHWYNRKTVLHHKEWADQVAGWESCSSTKPTCPDIYASESIKAACNWAYKDVHEGSTLEDDYFLSRLPITNLRLAQAGVRLAATLNRLFS